MAGYFFEESSEFFDVLFLFYGSDVDGSGDVIDGTSIDDDPLLCFVVLNFMGEFLWGYFGG